MQKNESNIDRFIRVILGGALIIFAIMNPSSPYAIWAFIGIIPLTTGLIGWCPIYRIFGISTCKISDASDSTEE